ncbi:hypothetical protein GCM10011316_29890 [Roseibium aquae]|uniref:Uncharacterized protein n=1 Tax=Roseibium aquae TaxID=1323746 RepID=A0A916TLJ4_9HYPH|nr:hypothetical protein [Roseibium aquae]GGB55829.1 hypothetical protein GCM10011316_29890 [Roseibium aquae]
MRQLLLAAAACLAATTDAFACNTPNILIGKDGTAEYVSPETDRRDELEVLVGDAPSPDSMLVFDARDGNAMWVDKADLSRVGVGFNTLDGTLTYSGPDECRPPELPIKLPEGNPIPDAPELFPDGDPDKQPIELFPDDANEAGPRSGLWRAESGPSEMEGCPAMMRNAFPGSPGALPGMTSEARRLEFSRPFHPDALELSRTAGVRWAADGANRWVTTDLGADALRQIPQGQGDGSKIVWTLTMISPEEISFRRVIEIVLPVEAAALMGVSPDGCRVMGTDRWLRVGD